jgi:hypothetical protein
VVKRHAAIVLTRAVFVLAFIVLASSSRAAAREAIRYVPQLELTDLQPIQVSFCPDDETLLLVVNAHGRIDLFDLSNPGRPAVLPKSQRLRQMQHPQPSRLRQREHHAKI